MEKQSHTGPVALILVAGFAAYATSFFGVFVFDDYSTFVEPAGMRAYFPPGELIPLGVRNRPLARWFFTANIHFGGLSIWTYHMVNLVIHLSAAGLVYLNVNQLLSQSRWRIDGANTTQLAALVAALWVVHPLTTAAVTYITQRIESLAAFFYLCSLWQLGVGIRARNATWWFIGSIATAGLGFATKETVISLPLVAALYDRVFWADCWRDVLRRRGWCHLMYWCGAGCLLLVTSGALLDGDSHAYAGFGYGEISAWQYFRSQPAVLIHYISLAFWPAKLCLDYAWPIAQSSWEIYGYGGIVLALLAASVALLKYAPPLGFCGVAFFLILAPTSTFMPIADIAAEHRMYLPLVFVIGATVLGARALARRFAPQVAERRVAVYGICFLLLIALGTRTSIRNLDYANELGMWLKIVNDRPQHPRAWNNVGVLREASGEFADARINFEKSLSINPNYAPANFNLGRLLVNSGDTNRAGTYFETAIRNNPRHVLARITWAQALSVTGDFAKAETLLHEAIAIDPTSITAFVTLAKLEAKLGKWDDSLSRLNVAAKLGAQRDELHWQRGEILFDAGHWNSARDSFRECLYRRPNSLAAALRLSWIESTAKSENLRKPKESLARMELVMSRVPPNTIELRDTLGVVYAANGRFGDAVKMAEIAKQLAGNNATRAAEIDSRLSLYRESRPYDDARHRPADERSFPPPKF